MESNKSNEIPPQGRLNSQKEDNVGVFNQLMLWFNHYGSFVYVCLLIGNVSLVSNVAYGHQV